MIQVPAEFCYGSRGGERARSGAVAGRPGFLFIRATTRQNLARLGPAT